MNEKYKKFNPISLLFTDKALEFINNKRLNSPTILVNLGYRSGGGGCSGGPSSPIPYANVMLVDGENPGEGFTRIETKAGIPVYMAKPLVEVAEKAGNPLVIDAPGLSIFKRLKLEGLDLSSLCKVEREASCH